MNTEATIIVPQLGDPKGRALTSMYNLGLDHAIETIKNFLVQMPGIAEPLISKIEKLKQ